MKEYVYRDVLNDDFAGNNIKSRPLPDDYRRFAVAGISSCIIFWLHPLCFCFRKSYSTSTLSTARFCARILKPGFICMGIIPVLREMLLLRTLFRFPGRRIFWSIPMPWRFRFFGMLWHRSAAFRCRIPAGIIAVSGTH